MEKEEQDYEVEDKMNTILKKVLQKLEISRKVESKAHEMLDDIYSMYEVTTEEGSGFGGDDEDY